MQLQADKGTLRNATSLPNCGSHPVAAQHHQHLFDPTIDSERDQ